jgi:hypothetical protein
VKGPWRGSPFPIFLLSYRANGSSVTTFRQFLVGRGCLDLTNKLDGSPTAAAAVGLRVSPQPPVIRVDQPPWCLFSGCHLTILPILQVIAAGQADPRDNTTVRLLGPPSYQRILFARLVTVALIFIQTFRHLLEHPGRASKFADGSRSILLLFRRRLPPCAVRRQPIVTKSGAPGTDLAANSNTRGTCHFLWRT